MYSYTRILLFAALLLLPGSPVSAQIALDPSGHWQGAIQVTNPNDGSTVQLSMDVDLMKTGKGDFAGQVTIPQQKVKDIPLVNISVAGLSISFQIVLSEPGDNTFKGALSADGASMSGDITHSGVSFPFTIARTGEATMEPPAKSTPIGKELEGTWSGTLSVDGKQLQMVLTMTNQADGTAIGHLVNLEHATLEIPIATITQKASNLTLDVKAANGSYAGVLNAAGTELAGTWTENSVALPLTFRRAVQ